MYRYLANKVVFNKIDFYTKYKLVIIQKKMSVERSIRREP